MPQTPPRPAMAQPLFQPPQLNLHQHPQALPQPAQQLLPPLPALPALPALPDRDLLPAHMRQLFYPDLRPPLPALPLQMPLPPHTRERLYGISLSQAMQAMASRSESNVPLVISLEGAEYKDHPYKRPLDKSSIDNDKNSVALALEAAEETDAARMAGTLPAAGQYKGTPVLKWFTQQAPNPAATRHAVYVQTGTGGWCNYGSACLVTDGLQSCVAVVAINEAKTKSYLTHVEFRLSAELFPNWTGVKTAAIMYKRHAHLNAYKLAELKRILEKEIGCERVIMHPLEWMSSTAVIMYKSTCIVYQDNTADDPPATSAAAWNAHIKDMDKKALNAAEYLQLPREKQTYENIDRAHHRLMLKDSIPLLRGPSYDKGVIEVRSDIHATGAAPQTKNQQG